MSKISEKLKYLRETKGLIREAIEEQGGIIEDTTPFRKYADIIKNIPGNIGELETWRKVDLPVEFDNPVYFGPDSDHIFVTEYSYSTSDRISNGLWLYCYSTNTWTQLYNKYAGYICMSQADDGSYVFYPYTYSSVVTFDLLSYNLQTEEFKVVGEGIQLSSYSYANEFEHGMTFVNWGKQVAVWNKHLNQVTINASMSYSKGTYTFGDYVIFNLGADSMNIGNVHTGVISSMPGNYTTTNAGSLTLVTLTNNIGLLSYGYSTTTANYLGLYLINGESKTLTQIYTAGYDWEHMEEFANCYLVTSTGSNGILKITKNNYQVKAITTSGSAYVYNDSLTQINERMVKLNDTTAVCTHAEGNHTVALLDVDTEEWYDIYVYTGSSSVERRILRSDKMVMILGGQYGSAKGYAIHRNSTIVKPNYIQCSLSVSSSNYYRTDWGCSVSSSESASTARVCAYVVEGDTIKEQVYNSLWYVRDTFESYNAAYYYNNNNDDPDDAYVTRIDKKDFSKCGSFKFAFTGTYYITGMWQGANDTVYIMGTSHVLGVYDEKTGNIKYYGDLGEHLPDYSASTSLPRWPEFSMIQAGPEHNYNWCTRGIIFCDEKDIVPQYTFNVGNVWRNYTYNSYYIEDIFSRRMYKIIPDECDFKNYWTNTGKYDWEELWFNFKVGITQKYMIVCKDGEE